MNRSERRLYPNVQVDLDQLIVFDDFVDSREMTQKQRMCCRATVLDTAVIQSLDDAQCEARIQNPWGDVILLGLTILILSSTAVLDQLVFLNPASGVPDFISRLPAVASYLLSWIVCLMCCHFGGITEKNYTNLLKTLPLGGVWCVQEIVAFFVIKTCGTTMWHVLSQSRLLVSMLLAMVLSGRHFSLCEWLLGLYITLCVICYVGGSLSVTLSSSVVALLVIASLAIVAAAAANTMLELMMKMDDRPYLRQFCDQRLIGLLWALVSFHGETAFMNAWDRYPLSGWTWRCLVLAANDSVRAFATTLIAKRMSTVAKTLAGSLSLTAAYILQYLILGTSFRFQALLQLAALSIGVIAFGTSKRDTIKMQELANFSKHGR